MEVIGLRHSLWVTQGSGPRPLRGVRRSVRLVSSSCLHPSGRPRSRSAPSWTLPSCEPELCRPQSGDVSQAPGPFLFGAPLSALWRLLAPRVSSARQRGWIMNEVVPRFWAFCPLSQLLIIYFPFNHWCSFQDYLHTKQNTWDVDACGYISVTKIGKVSPCSSPTKSRLPPTRHAVLGATSLKSGRAQVPPRRATPGDLTPS